MQGHQVGQAQFSTEILRPGYQQGNLSQWTPSLGDIDSSIRGVTQRAQRYEEQIGLAGQAAEQPQRMPVPVQGFGFEPESGAIRLQGSSDPPSQGVPVF